MRPIYAIETVDLKKSYKHVEALRGMSLQVPQGSLCGLVGLNGAGKTTTIRLLLAMAKADSGSARALGLDALSPEENRLIRARTAYIPERKELFPYMTAQAVINFTSSFYPNWSKDLEAHYAKSSRFRWTVTSRSSPKERSPSSTCCSPSHEAQSY